MALPSPLDIPPDFLARAMSSITTQAALSPYTCGARSVDLERVVALTDEHLDQSDTSANASIWGLYPVESKYEALLALGEKQTKEAESLPIWRGEKFQSPLDRKELGRAIFLHERARITVNLAVLFNFNDVLTKRGAPPKIRKYLRDKKANGEVQPLAKAIQSAEAAKETANTLFKAGHAMAAGAEYVKALATLYPWTSTTLLFEAPQVLSCGLADMENKLWGNLAVIGLKLATPAHIPDQEAWVARGDVPEERVWLSLAYDAANTVRQRRWTSFSQLAKSLKRLKEASFRLAPDKTFGAGPVHKEWTLFSMAQASVDMVAMKPDNKDSPWAHWQCVEEHHCTLPRDAEKAVTSPAVGFGFFAGLTDDELGPWLARWRQMSLAGTFGPAARDDPSLNPMETMMRQMGRA